jgi:hypothetical protein
MIEKIDTDMFVGKCAVVLTLLASLLLPQHAAAADRIKVTDEYGRIEGYVVSDFTTGRRAKVTDQYGRTKGYLAPSLLYPKRTRITDGYGRSKGYMIINR